MVVKEIHGNELYVYMNGELLYKRWLDQNHGIIIQNNGWGNFRAGDVWQHVENILPVQNTPVSS